LSRSPKHYCVTDEVSLLRASVLDVPAEGKERRTQSATMNAKQ